MTSTKGRGKVALIAELLLTSTHLIGRLSGGLTLLLALLTQTIGVQDLKVTTLTAELEATRLSSRPGRLLGLIGFLRCKTSPGLKTLKSLLAEGVIDTPGIRIEGSNGSLSSLSAKATHHIQLAGGVLLLELVSPRLQISIQSKKPSSLTSHRGHLLGSKHRLQTSLRFGLVN